MRILEEKELSLQCYSMKLRYCASRPPGLEIIFDINFYRACHRNCQLHVITYLFDSVLSSHIKIRNINFQLF